VNQFIVVLTADEDIERVGTTRGDRWPGGEVATQIDPSALLVSIPETVDELVVLLAANEHVERVGAT
jgi:hypothetical protein